HLPLLPGAAVEPARKERLEGPGQCSPGRIRIFGEVREELLSEEWIASRMRHDLLLQLRIYRSTGKLLDEGARRGGSQNLEFDQEAGRCRAAPAGTRLEQVPARQTKDKYRAGRPRAEVLNEIEQRRLGPVDVVERHDDGALARERLQQST